MKANFKVNSRLVVELDVDDQKDLFAKLGQLQEVFGECKCGKCSRDNVKFLVREDKESNKYYELLCTDCWYRFSFGVNKVGGTLFPKRRLDDGSAKPNNGWMRWDKEKQEMVG